MKCECKTMSSKMFACAKMLHSQWILTYRYAPAENERMKRVFERGGTTYSHLTDTTHYATPTNALEYEIIFKINSFHTYSTTELRPSNREH